jgi:hypothetical protein
MRAHVHTYLAQVLDLRGKFRKQVESYRTDGNVPEYPPVQLANLLMVLIKYASARTRIFRPVARLSASSCSSFYSSIGLNHG